MKDDNWGAVIVAAGSGTRFGSRIPKQFVALAGKIVVDWSVDAFLSLGSVSELIVVTPPDEKDWKPWWKPPRGIRTAPGGPRRQDSVLAGLNALRRSSHVLIHDAARPLVTPALIERVMRGVFSAGAAVPVVPVRDTVKRVSDASSVLSTVPRKDLVLSQTPQGFRLEQLLGVLRSSGEVTDESAAMESAGMTVLAVRGDPMNIKLTDPEDLDLLRSLSGIDAESRTGIGLDFHPFREGIPLMLGGCRIEGGSGLDGHSDGDAVLHAVADALLSASRLGDIGVHFPPGDSEWENADSGVILKRVASMVRSRGWEVSQLDITVMADFPRISQLREMMMERIAGILGIPPERIWVKGTTTNTLGDIGRGRGLGCMVVAVISRVARQRAGE
ncbi:MAG: 2-C-methyl-D-erythritol 4-phosphate cytidylyltransferase [Candidatus Fermentibacteraceae bacterium]|nr:2-C-methyl-D-erythritol 4-phosphate cytidylyltransferase [Candidatus Fermentibacteraceae bacterium]